MWRWLCTAYSTRHETTLDSAGNRLSPSHSLPASNDTGAGAHSCCHARVWDAVYETQGRLAKSPRVEYQDGDLYYSYRPALLDGLILPPGRDGLPRTGKQQAEPTLLLYICGDRPSQCPCIEPIHSDQDAWVRVRSARSRTVRTGPEPGPLLRRPQTSILQMLGVKTDLCSMAHTLYTSLLYLTRGIQFQILSAERMSRDEAPRRDVGGFLP